MFPTLAPCAREINCILLLAYLELRLTKEAVNSIQLLLFYIKTMISTINERLDTINNEIKKLAAELDRLRDLKDKCCSHRGAHHWFAGFNDAEGNFQVYPKKRVLNSGQVSKVNVGYSYHLSLHLRDTVLLDNIKENLGLQSKGDIGTRYTYAEKEDTRLAVNDMQLLAYVVWHASALLN